MPADHAADALALPDDALLAPGIRHVVATLRAGMRAGPDITTMPLGEARARYAAQQQLWQPRVPPGVTIRRFLIATGAGPLPAVAVHAQGGQLSAARVLYLHGGGWVLGSVDTHLAAMARLALGSGTEVVGIDYRLAPEAPFPAALHDCLSAWHWLEADSAGRRLFIAGDSAGANLALAAMLELRGQHATMPAAALLFYGVFGPDCRGESSDRFGSGDYGLSTARMAWFRSNYLQAAGEAGTTDARISPLLADLTGLPPMLIMAAQCDPLADDSRALARRARAAGLVVTEAEQPGLVHGFLQMAAVVPEAATALDDAARYLRARCDAPLG
jgi:acetyl esterase/lipase